MKDASQSDRQENIQPHPSSISNDVVEVELNEELRLNHPTSRYPLIRERYNSPESNGLYPIQRIPSNDTGDISLLSNRSISLQTQKTADDCISVIDYEDDSEFVYNPSKLEYQMFTDQIQIPHNGDIAAANLPAELMYLIFSHVDNAKDMRAALYVCRNWCKCSIQSIWNRPHINSVERLEYIKATLESAEQTFNYSSFIKKLNFTLIPDFINDKVLNAFQVCDNLERLNLSGCRGLTGATLGDFFAKNARLSFVDLSGIQSINDDHVKSIAINCPNIQGLHLSNCYSISDDAIITVAQKCPTLRRLKLAGCTRITDESILQLSKHCKGLFDLDLSNIPYITNDGFRSIFMSSQSLRELRLNGCSQIQDIAFINIDTPEVPVMSDSLRSLDVTWCVELTDNLLDVLVQSCPSLKTLVLAKCSHFTDRGVSKLVKLGKNLHYLHLGYCHLITDRSVTFLARFCSRLRYLDLANCNRITDISLLELAKLPKLRRIGLVKCAQISDVTLYALASSETIPHVLERAHLSYCVHLTIGAIFNFVDKCKNLTHLSLTGVPALVRHDLTRFARVQPIDTNIGHVNALCVFSGQGVIRLRNHLSMLSNHSRLSDAFYNFVPIRQDLMAFEELTDAADLIHI